MSWERSATQRYRIWRYDATLHSLAEVRTVVNAVADAMLAAECSRGDIFGMRLALDEAICNAIKHGNRNDPGKKVQVRCHITRDLVRMEVEDEGEGFDPHQVPDPLEPNNLERPCGRGLLLMRRYAAGVHFNERGNCVTLTHSRSAG